MDKGGADARTEGTGFQSEGKLVQMSRDGGEGGITLKKLVAVSQEVNGRRCEQGH